MVGAVPAYTYPQGYMRMKVKISFGTRQIYMLCGLAVGVFVALIMKEVPSKQELAGGFMHAFPAEFSASAIRRAVTFQFLPAILIALSGAMLFCRGLGTLLLSARAALDGFIFVGFFRAAYPHDAIFYIICVYLAVIEGAALLALNSMSRMAQRFLADARRENADPPVLRYALEQSFYCGLIFALYLMRGTVVLLF